MKAHHLLTANSILMVSVCAGSGLRWWLCVLYGLSIWVIGALIFGVAEFHRQRKADREDF